MSKKLDLTGQRFGRLTATECLGSIKGQRYWAVKCDCGNENLVAQRSLRSGLSASCGCLRDEAVSKSAEWNLVHGGTSQGKKTVEYRAWSDMRFKGDQSFVPEWNDFQQFFKDVGWKPSPKHQLKRRDVRKPHGPTNTYWKDPFEKTPTHADLGDEFFLDMRGAFTRTTKTTQERKRTAECVLR